MGKKSKHKKVKKISEVELQTVSKGHSQYYCWAILILVVLLAGFVRLRLLSIPLERDEGEFAYMGQLILQGIPPYLISYNMKLPGIYAAYTLMMSVFWTNGGRDSSWIPPHQRSDHDPDFSFGEAPLRFVYRHHRECLLCDSFRESNCSRDFCPCLALCSITRDCRNIAHAQGNRLQ